VKEEINVLIITDGSEETAGMAAHIAEEIGAAREGSKVQVKPAADFKGNDILPAQVFFLGCKAPEPDSFAYLANVLKHINLAGRPCGVFSPESAEAAEYLAALLRDSEAALNPQPFFSDSVDTVRKWIASTMAGLS